MFWDEDRVEKWRNKIFLDPQNPDTSVESCFNLICLGPDAHARWTMGLFALKPLKLSNDKKKLDVQFFWQRQYSHRPADRIDLVKETKSSKGLSQVENLDPFPVHSERQSKSYFIANLQGFIRPSFEQVYEWIPPPLSMQDSMQDMARVMSKVQYEPILENQQKACYRCAKTGRRCVLHQPSHLYSMSNPPKRSRDDNLDYEEQPTGLQPKKLKRFMRVTTVPKAGPSRATTTVPTVGPSRAKTTISTAGLSRATTASISDPSRAMSTLSPDLDNVHYSGISKKTLPLEALPEEVPKMGKNPGRAGVMILELMSKYSFSLSRLKELLRGKLNTLESLS
jgi:hypothetical protein